MCLLGLNICLVLSQVLLGLCVCVHACMSMCVWGVGGGARAGASVCVG